VTFFSKLKKCVAAFLDLVVFALVVRLILTVSTGAGLELVPVQDPLSKESNREAA
jgi:hypothetical protein